MYIELCWWAREATAKAIAQRHQIPSTKVFGYLCDRDMDIGAVQKAPQPYIALWVCGKRSRKIEFMYTERTERTEAQNILSFSRTHTPAPIYSRDGESHTSANL